MGQLLFGLCICLGGASLCWWYVRRALKAGVIETNYGTFRADDDPSAFRGWVLLFSAFATLFSFGTIGTLVALLFPAESGPVLGCVGAVAFLAIPILFAGLAVKGLRDGVVSAKGATYARADHPIWYWTLIGLYTLAAIGFFSVMGVIGWGVLRELAGG